VGGATGTDSDTWGAVSDSGLYTAPVTPPWTGKINVKATLKSDTTKTANAVVTVVFSNATLNGHYALRYRGVDRATDQPGTRGVLHDTRSMLRSLSFLPTKKGLDFSALPSNRTRVLPSRPAHCPETRYSPPRDIMWKTAMLSL
jgi:hypothetical protein